MLNFVLFRSYNDPLDLESMRRLSRKNFSEETMKKVAWVHHMYSQWRIYCNSLDNGEYIYCNLDGHETITQENIVFSMSRFVREVTKLNGEQFPAKTLYEILMCVQFHLESIRFNWQLLNEKISQI